MASVNRAPFDLAEAESELVAGFHTEYSGLRWSYFLHGRVWLDVRRQRAGGHSVFRRLERSGADHALAGARRPTTNPLLHYIGNLLGMLNFIVKCVLGVTFMMWVRWTLPRLRIDQVMKTCLKYCTPIAAVDVSGRRALDVSACPAASGLRARPYAAIRASTSRQRPDWACRQEACRHGSARPAVKRQDRQAGGCGCPTRNVAAMEDQSPWHRSTGIRSFFCCSRSWPACLPWPWCSRAISCGWRFIWSMSLGATAGLFFLAGADFVGSMQLMIYVGGTLVLLVFRRDAHGPRAVRLDEDPRRRMDLACLLGGCLLAMLVPAALASVPGKISLPRCSQPKVIPASSTAGQLVSRRHPRLLATRPSRRPRATAKS